MVVSGGQCACSGGKRFERLREGLELGQRFSGLAAQHPILEPGVAVVGKVVDLKLVDGPAVILVLPDTGVIGLIDEAQSLQEFESLLDADDFADEWKV
jgi:hypothetical protein